MKQLIYLAPVALNSFEQRPHHFVRWFQQKYDAKVIWIEPGPSRYPKWHDLKRLAHRSDKFLGPKWALEPWLETVAFFTLPVEPLRVGRKLNRCLRYFALRKMLQNMGDDALVVIGKPCDLAIELLELLPHHPAVFDMMDNMSAFSHGAASNWMMRAEMVLGQRAQSVWTSSFALEKRAGELFGPHKVRCVPNGLTPPRSLVNLSANSGAGAPVFGYVGVIAAWFDWEVVLKISSLFPEGEVHLYGPLVVSLPADLPANVKVFPPIAHAAIYDVISGFSVGLIPFRRNALTDFVDPIKFYEYRAVGLPVLSTEFGDMCQRAGDPMVLLIDKLITRDALASFIQRRSPPMLVKDFCEQNSWQTRFDLIDF